jgi:large subunit ribosomal protein L5
MGQTSRLSTFYDEIVAPDYLLICYDPESKRKKQLPPLQWDGTSPYHKNRPLPKHPRLAKLRQPVTATNIPKISHITVHSIVPSAIFKRAHLLDAAMAIQTITGQRPRFIYSSVAVSALKIRAGMMERWTLSCLLLGIPIAVKTVLKGPGMLSFLSIVAETVLPRLKDFEGVHFVKRESGGSITIRIPGSAMSSFPQIEGLSDNIYRGTDES